MEQIKILVCYYNIQTHSPFRALSCYCKFDLSLRSLRRLPGSVNLYLVHILFSFSGKHKVGKHKVRKHLNFMKYCAF